MLVQYVISGLALGGIYALIALGYNMIWRAMGIINFAQGQVFMLGAFFGLTALAWFGHLHFVTPIMFVFVGVAGIILAIVTQFLVYQPLQRRTRRERLSVNMLAGTIAVGIILENTTRIVYSAEPEFFPRIFGTRVFTVAGVTVPEQYLRIILIAIALVAVLQLILFRTKIGRAMRAVAQDRDTAALMGVDVSKSLYATLAVTYALGSIAGMMVAPIYYASFDVGQIFGLKGFTSAVIGGIGTIPGAVLGGFILGVVENLAGGYVSSAYRNVIAFTLLILMLMFRPAGLLGVKKVEKV